ncbi:hypothetical protein C8R45DRAFT_823222, partial [Mycena sanguinolenta]
IILQVENTLYRVYRGLLPSRSIVFHDTFSMPQPQSTMEEQQQIEGCPVVQLHDKEKDFTRFLKALPLWILVSAFATISDCVAISGIAELSSVLRISDKYDVVTLRESMVSILCDIYPSSLDEWLKRGEAVPPGYRIAQQDCLTVLNLARELDILSILPGAMYLAATTQGLTVLYGRPGKRIRNADDRKCYTFAFPELMLARRRAAATFLIREEEVDDCENEEGECDTERFRWLAEDFSSEPDPFQGELYW